MKREWKPGDVAMARSLGGEFLVVRTFGGSSGDYWSAPMGWPSGVSSDFDCTFRPLVVIDPEDSAAVNELTQRTALVLPGHSIVGVAAKMQAALRSLATPPKPDEPTGLGAVVEDAEGTRYVRTGYARAPWHNEHEDTIHTWAMFDAVRVLSEGVAR